MLIITKYYLIYLYNKGKNKTLVCWMMGGLYYIGCFVVLWLRLGLGIVVCGCYDMCDAMFVVSSVCLRWECLWLIVLKCLVTCCGCESLFKVGVQSLEDGQVMPLPTLLAGDRQPDHLNMDLKRFFRYESDTVDQKIALTLTLVEPTVHTFFLLSTYKW